MLLKRGSFEWLYSGQGVPGMDGDGAEESAILPPCPGGQVHMEQVDVFGDAALYVFKARFEEAQVLAADDGRSGDHLAMILTQAGGCRLRAEDYGQDCPVDRGSVILHLPEGRRMSYVFSPGEPIHAAAFTLGRGVLEGLLGQDRPPAALREWLEGRSGGEPRANRIASSSAFAMTARQLVDNPYQGPARRLFFEAKVLEGFAELLHRLGEDAAEPRGSALTSWERARVSEARDMLMERVADPPALSELAKLVGLPVKRLDRLFREAFGTTPFGWVRDYRLNLAQRLLAEESLPIKQVAYRLGYANVHNFTHAFVARFGMPPGALRGRSKSGR